MLIPGHQTSQLAVSTTSRLTTTQSNNNTVQYRTHQKCISQPQLSSPFSPSSLLPSPCPPPPQTTSIDNDNSSFANATIPDYYEAVHQAEYRLGDILDRKDYESLGLAMAQDAVYDKSCYPRRIRHERPQQDQIEDGGGVWGCDGEA